MTENMPVHYFPEVKNMSKSLAKDMTTGSPMKLIAGFAVPLLFGFLFQQFYSVVDTILVPQVLLIL